MMMYRAFLLIKAWTTDISTRMMLTSTAAQVFQLRLIAGDSNTSLVHILVEIEDTLNCMTPYKLQPAVVVTPDKDAIENLINTFQQTITKDNDTNEIFNLTDDSSQHMIRQVLNSLSQGMNVLNSDNVADAIASKNVTFLEIMLNIFFCLRWCFCCNYFNIPLRKYQ